jgi:hypothetical protein
MDRAELVTLWLLTETEREIQAQLGRRPPSEVLAALSMLRRHHECLLRDEFEDVRREAISETWDLANAD